MKVVELPHVRHYGGEALLVGTLRADPDLDGGCFWLEDRDGGQHGLAALEARHGGEPLDGDEVSARFYEDDSRAELVVGDSVLAREGDEIEAGGGEWDIARLDLDEELPCQFDDTVQLLDLYDLEVVERDASAEDEGPPDGDPADEGSGGEDSAEDDVVMLPHVVHYGGEALIASTLGADPDMDGGCFYLENRDGEDRGLAALAPQRDGEVLEELMLRARFYEDGSTAELILEGEVIAREGDEIEASGGSWRIDRLGGCPGVRGT